MGKNMMHRRTSSGRGALRALAAAVALSLAVADASLAAVFPEVEPNDSKATATPAGPMIAGDSILGNSISAATTGLDYFDVTLAPYSLLLTICTSFNGPEFPLTA